MTSYDLEALSKLSITEFKELCSKNGITWKGALNPIMRKVKAKKLLTALNASGDSNIQLAQEPRCVTPTETKTSTEVILDKESSSFYAIKSNKLFIPKDELIFNSISPALIKHKGLKDPSALLSPRLHTYSQAVNWIQEELKPRESIKKAKETKINLSPRPGTKDFLVISKFITNNDTDGLRQYLLENPNRIINTSSEGPVILKPGMNWNPIHLAASVNNVSVLHLYMSLLTDDSFTARLYEIASTIPIKSTALSRIISFHLNDIDRQQHNTPLHIAAKKHHLEFCDALITIYHAKTTLRNKNRDTARELLSPSLPNFDKMVTLFGNMYIVKIDTQESENFCTVQKKSAISPDISYLGPCSEMMANKLYRELTAKNDNRQGSLNRRKDWYLKDFEKGVHRFARLLSFSEDVMLVEYWPFLREQIHWDWPETDILQKLEDHFESMTEPITLDDTIDNLCQAFSSKMTILSVRKIFYLENDMPTKADTQFFDALQQRIPDENDFQEIIDKFPLSNEWYKNISKFYKSDKDRKFLKTPIRKRF